MRISTTMMMSSYADDLNDKYELINKYSNQVSTKMSFQRASEDPVAAMQTIKSCTEFAINQQSQTNQEQASSWMSATESTLNAVNNIVTTANQKALEAANGTNSASDYGNYAVAFQNYSDEIVSTLNTSYDGKYIFGEGTDGSAPFKMDTSGSVPKLMYCNYNANPANYVAVNTLTSGSIGSMKLKTPISVGTDSDFDIATSGLDTIISDFSGNSGTATNIVDKLNSVISELKKSPPDTSGLSDLVTSTSNAQDAILKVKVAVGEKSNMLDQISGRLTDDEANLTAALSNSMLTNPVESITNYNMAETIYKESMSMASTVLQSSLFDYLK